MSINFLLERLLNEDYLINSLPKSEFDDYKVLLYRTNKSLIVNNGRTHSINKKSKFDRQIFRFGFRPSSLDKGYVIVKPKKSFKFEYLTNGLIDEEATKNKVLSALGTINNQLLFKYQIMADYDAKHRRIIIKPNKTQLNNPFSNPNTQKISQLYPIIINKDYILFNGRDPYSNGLISDLLRTNLYLNLTTVKYLNSYQQLCAKLKNAELNHKTITLSPSQLKTLKAYSPSQFKTFINILEDDFETLIKSEKALPYNLSSELNNKLTEALKDKLSTDFESLEKTLSLEFEYALRKGYQFFKQLNDKTTSLTSKNGQTISFKIDDYNDFPEEFESLLSNFHYKGLKFLLKESNNFLHLTNYFNLSSYKPYVFEKHFKELTINSPLNYLKLVMDSFAFDKKQGVHNFSYPDYSIKFIKPGFGDKSLIKQNERFSICNNDSFKYKKLVKKFGFNINELIDNSLIIKPKIKFNRNILFDLANSIDSLESILINNGLKPEISYYFNKNEPVIRLKCGNSEVQLNKEYLLFNNNPNNLSLIKLLLDKGSNLFSNNSIQTKPARLIDFAKLIHKAEDLKSISNSMVSASYNGILFCNYIPKEGDKMCVLKNDYDGYLYNKIVSKEKIKNINAILKKTDNIVGISSLINDFEDPDFLKKTIMRFPNFCLDKGSIKRRFSKKMDYYYLTDGDDELLIFNDGFFLSYSETAFKVGESILKNYVNYYENKLIKNKSISQNINFLLVNERAFLKELINKYGLANNNYSIVNSHVSSLSFRQPLGLKSLNDLGDLTIFNELTDLIFINQPGLKFTEDLASLINLNYLKISNCDLKRAPKYISKLINLKELDLSENNIKKFNYYFFDDLHNINNLNLSDNKLKKLPNSFISLFAVKSINLSGNNFKKVPIEVMFKRTINHLDLSNNSLKIKDFNKSFNKSLRFIPNFNK